MRNTMTKITKDIIIETAYQLFFKHGYNNVTINDICKECKITKPTFYTYIKSKDDIGQMISKIKTTTVFF